MIVQYIQRNLKNYVKNGRFWSRWYSLLSWSYEKQIFNKISIIVENKYGINKDKYFENLKSLFFQKNKNRTFDIAFRNLGYELPKDWDNFVKTEILPVYRSFKPEEELEIIDKNFKIMLSYYNNQVPLCLITNGNYNVQRNKIDKLGISYYFEEILISDFFGPEYRKPSTYMFELVLKKYKLSSDEIIYYGDDERTDSCCELLGIKFINVNQLWKEIEEKLSEDTIIASNTSSIKITDLSEGIKNKKRFLGIHFFNPADRMPLIELSKTEVTDEKIYKETKIFLESLGKTVVEVKDSNGFIVNKILIKSINEAALLLDDNISSAIDIDNAMKSGANWPMGPLELADYIGLDICYNILLNFRKIDPNLKISKTLEKNVQNNCLGKKSKKGFYEY